MFWIIPQKLLAQQLGKNYINFETSKLLHTDFSVAYAIHYSHRSENVFGIIQDVFKYF